MRATEHVWIEAQRTHAEDYLRAQGVDHLGVGERPAFHVHPYVALWAVQSKSAPGWIGWWAITGDLPADYISSSEGRHPREALRAFARHWREASGCWRRGEPHRDYRLGTPDEWPEPGELLGRGAVVIDRWADVDEIWIDVGDA
jgi:hypothetical protein